MADIFLSYKSEDRTAAKTHADALAAEGLSVWWDPVLRTGETYDEVIERNLREAKLVVVLWSQRSVKSKWVRAEATIGERKGALMPVLIEACERPIAFELTQTAELVGWTGNRNDARWRDFIADLSSALATRQAQERAHAAPPPPDALTIETLFWSSISDGADPADFEAYIARYPHGHFVEIARNKMRALRQIAQPAYSTLVEQPRDTHSPARRRPSAPRASHTERAQLSLFRRPWLILGGTGLLVVAAIVIAFVLPRFTEQASTSSYPALPDARTTPASTRAPLKVSSDQLFDFALFRDCDVCPELVLLPGGAYVMGSADAHEVNRPETSHPTAPHEVTVPRFAVARFEATFEEWDACVSAGGCVGYRPADQGWGRGRQPAINVNLIDALTYVRWLSELTGHTYRLLTDSEWEYAARAGTTTAWSWGDNSHDACEYANSYDRAALAEQAPDARKDEICDDGVGLRTTAVGRYRRNPFGLFDMHGNAMESVLDCFTSALERLPTDGSPYRDQVCARFVVRGGSYGYGAGESRSADRGFLLDKYHRNESRGFRVAREP